GFAVPVDTIKKAIPLLVEEGRVKRVWLGISGQSIFKKTSKKLKLKDVGVLVADVFEGGPAKKSGIRGATRYQNVGNRLFSVGGDLIINIAGRPIRTMEELNDLLEAMRPGDKIIVTVMRKGKKKELKVTLDEIPMSYRY
ncbi:MAG: PDZ domain-containing protein, partial [Thermodesulfobacteriota bacterium]